MSKCTLFQEVAGPNSGCAEFAEPDVFRCPNEAVVEIEYDVLDTGDYDSRGIIHVHDSMCAWHAEVLDEELEFLKGYGLLKSEVVRKELVTQE